jgi:RNA polymerase sigma-70 factor (ECF subfamily)
MDAILGADAVTDCPRDCFESVVGPHLDALYRAAMRLTRSRDDAEDLVQEVALRVLPRLAQLSTLDAPLGWLLKIQYRVFIDDRRRKARSPVSAQDEHIDTAESPDASPEQITERQQFQQLLSGAWPLLTRAQRGLLAMHAEGYSLAELEQITGLNRNALGVRLHRARARLGQLLRKHMDGTPGPAGQEE